MFATTLSPPLRFLLGFACFIIIVAGIKAAAELVIPFLLSAFIALLCAPALLWLEERKVPTALAITIVVLIMVSTLGFVSMVVATSINSFTKQLPEYQQSLQHETIVITTWLAQHGMEISENTIKSQINPGRAMDLVRRVLTGFSNALTNFFLIFLTVMFMLLEASSMPAKWTRAMGPKHSSMNALNQFNHSVKQYLIIKTVVSLATASFIGIWLGLQGIDFLSMWILLVFILNFIPNIGSIIAAIPAVLISFVQFGFAGAGITALGFMIINIVMGSVIEPRYMGRGLGLSTLVVFLSLLFWGWVLGPVGMLLSIPLTMIVKLALESNEETHWLAVLLDNK